MPRLLKYCLFGMICVTLILAGCGGSAPVAAPPKDAPPEDSPAKDELLAPDFSYRDSEGNDISLSDLRGQVVLLNFWATWCPPCVYEMPFLEDAHQQTQGNAVILAINVGERAATVSAFVEEHGLTLPIILDQNGAIAQQYRANQFPTSVIIDADGIIREYKIGPFTSVEEILDRLERTASS
jgi:peroxiredoxin